MNNHSTFYMKISCQYNSPQGLLKLRAICIWSTPETLLNYNSYIYSIVWKSGNRFVSNRLCCYCNSPPYPTGKKSWFLRKCKAEWPRMASYFLPLPQSWIPLGHSFQLPQFSGCYNREYATEEDWEGYGRQKSK